MKMYSQQEKLDLIKATLHEKDSVYRIKNLGEFKNRKILAYINVANEAELQKVFEICTLPGDTLPVYPNSTGKNWGLGSFLPVQENGVLLDLSRMNNILELDFKAGIAVIEPGVTQQQLSEVLVGTPYMLNVTSSHTATSILGNALDRGVGFHRQRDQDLIGAELLTAAGKYLKLGGYWDVMRDTLNAFHYKHGVRPNLMPLLFQSNLGVITKGIISLVPRLEKIVVLRIPFPTEKLNDILQLFQQFYQEETIKSVMKIYNASAAKMYSGGKPMDRVDGFYGYFSLEGPSDICGTKLKRVLSHVEQLGVFCEVIESTTTDILSKMIYECFHGNPRYNDAMINASFQVENCEVDAYSPEGWLSFLPIIPFEAESLRHAFSLIQRCTEGAPIRTMATMNIISRTAVDLVVALRFKRDRHHIAIAHRILDDLYLCFSKAGFYPYRLDIDHMNFALSGINLAHSQILQDIKNVFDPYKIIAPGRYGT